MRSPPRVNLSESQPVFHKCCVCAYRNKHLQSWVKCDSCPDQEGWSHIKCAGFSSKKDAESSPWICSKCQANSAIPFTAALAASPIAHTATQSPPPYAPATPSLADETPPWQISPARILLFSDEVVEETQAFVQQDQHDQPTGLDHSYFQPTAPIRDIGALLQVPPPRSHQSISCEATNSSPAITVNHIPKKCRNAFSRAFCGVVNDVTGNSTLEAYTNLHAIAKCVLAAPQRGGRQHGEHFVKVVNARLTAWNNGDRSLPKDNPRPRGRRRQRDPSPESEIDKRNRLVIKAAQDGQYGKAAKILSSNGLASPSQADVLAKMRLLHPTSPIPIIPDEECPAPTSVTEDEVLSAIRSFPEGTAAGPSGFRASFLKQVVSCPNRQQGAQTLTAITNFVNSVAAGKLSRDVAPFFCGARLHALKKKDLNSIRPIAVGEVLRRLVAKCLAFKLSPQAATFLEPHQLGVKTRGGCEAIIHATQAILSDSALPPNSKWVLQVDFSNAFNTMDRGHILSEVRRHLPGLSAFAEWCYGEHSVLLFGDNIIQSASGCQQGDPLGCILFAIGLHPLVCRIQAEVPDLLLHSWYLDDGQAIGKLMDIKRVFELIMEMSSLLGLSINMNKSYYWRCPEIRTYNLPASFLPIAENKDDGLVVLGAPVGSDAFSRNQISIKVHEIENLLVKLGSLDDSQIEFCLLRSCFGINKFGFILRTCNPLVNADVFAEFDDVQSRALSTLIGASISTSDPRWVLASLPVSLGGLGLRSAALHAPAAYVASNLQCAPIVGKLVNLPNPRIDISQASSLLANATANATTPLPGPLSSDTPQRLLSRRVDEARLYVLERMEADNRLCLILPSIRLPGTGDFLNVVPSPALKLHIHKTEFVMAIKYRLGLPVFPDESACGFCAKPSDIYGDHAISACHTSGGIIRRHDLLRDAIFDTAYAALLRPKKEERNLLDDDSRPGDLTIRGWARSRGKEKTAFDITVVSPLRQDVRAHAINDPKVVLQRSREAKFRKYEGKLPPEVGLIPLVVSIFGAWEDDARANLREIVSHQGRNSSCNSNVLTKQFFQRLSVCLQRENGSLLFERSPLSSLHPSVDGMM